MARRIYGLGETVYDIIFRDGTPQRAVAGGSTFNSLISLGRCGLQPVMTTEVGDDKVGEVIADFMTDNGVSTASLVRHVACKTPVSLAFLNAQNDATYQFYKDSNVPPRDADALPSFRAGDIILFGSYYAVNPVNRPFVKRFLSEARAAGCVIYYDVNFRAAHKADIPKVMGNMLENMSMATIVRGSTEDFDCLFGKTDADEIYRKHIKPYCATFICSDGGSSVRVYDSLHCYVYPVAPITTVSTIGAGDNFNAGVVRQISLQGLTVSHFQHGIDKQQWDKLVAEGETFASEVCQSFDNYISPMLAKKLINDELLSCKAFLFDLDGVIIDTEPQYEQFWGAIGREYLPQIPDFATRIKGSTLAAIYDTYFSDNEELRMLIKHRLDEFERLMNYPLFAKVEEFVSTAKSHGIPCVIVTSSNNEKMSALAQKQSVVAQLFDRIFTAEDVEHGKPAPDCYLQAAAALGYRCDDCVVFEDSVNGLKAAKASGAYVVGLTTTHSAEDVAQWADVVIPDLQSLAF